MSHFLIMALHSLLVAVFFAFLTREGLRSRLKVGLYLFAGMKITRWVHRDGGGAGTRDHIVRRAISLTGVQHKGLRT